MYTLKTIARRSTALGMVAAIVVSAILPAASAFADALNPLTERSLLLSSSAPGYQNTDGSGNPTYAPAGSGPNGTKTSETFTFTVSTQSPPDVKGFSFQYCTVAAGKCRAPGNNAGDADINRDGTIETPGDPDNDREDNATGHANGTSDLDIVGAFTQAAASTAPVGGEFQILVDNDGNATDDFVETSVADWAMAKTNAEDAGWVDTGSPQADGLVGKNNYIALHSATGLTLNAGDKVQIKFVADDSNYITNPGAGSFFVKINTYQSDDYANDFTDTVPLVSNTDVIDGGVTVANVMTDSIHIVTKVLETMSFSVGIQNPDTVDRDGTGTPGVTDTEHGRCEPMSQTSTITGLTNNRLNLGNPNAEYSLETGTAWDVYSYWRLSSNSSGGATVYYSGDTLANTSGDKIADMQSEQVSNPGTEQFGLGFVDASLDTFANVSGDDTFQSGWGVRSYPFKTVSTQTGATGIGAEDYDTLATQTESTGYDEATGAINGSPVAKFQFHATSNTIPEVIAKQNEMVISCATAKMRYIGNIGADTPAGVYTTKINYLAAPQY
jgi:hypothetical protein